MLVGFLSMPSNLVAAGETKPALWMPTPMPPPASKIKDNAEKFEPVLPHLTVGIARQHVLDLRPEFGGDLLIGIKIENPWPCAEREGMGFLLNVA
jgi:hypothetical protein